MGLKESTRIQLKVIQELGGNPDGMCVPLALIESLPDGFPPRDFHEEVIAKIICLLPEKGQEAV